MGNLLKYSTIAYAFLILIGYLYVDRFYSYWGIEIYSYLDASEVFILYLRNISLSIHFVIAIVTLIILPQKFITDIFKDVYVDNTGLIKIKYKIKFNRNTIVPVSIILVIAFALYYTTTYNIKSISYNSSSRLINILTFATYAISYYIAILYVINREEKYRIINNTVIIMLLCLQILSFSYSGAKNEYYDIRNKTVSTKFNFNYELTNYQSNDSLIFIGATSRYIFINNAKTKINYIFEKENIRNLSIITN